MTPRPDLADRPDVAAWVERRVADGSGRRLPELIASGRPELLYRLGDRHGVSVAACRTASLNDAELRSLMTYRLAQYLAVGFVDPISVFEAGLEHEPLSNVGPADVHIVAANAASGQILCYLSLIAPFAAGPGVTLRDTNRWLFPVEQVHGWGVYNRLRILPDLPITRIWETARFTKNQRAHTSRGLLIRGPIEVGVAAARLLMGALRPEIDAVVGDLEEGVAKNNLDYFQVPLVMIHGTIANVDRAAYKYPMYRFRNHLPFAFLVSDTVEARLHEVEAALERPGDEGLGALLALQATAGAIAHCALEPPDGLPRLANLELEQRRATMPVRRTLVGAGESLREMEVFRDLSPAEATSLFTLLTRLDVAPGRVVVRQGEAAHALFIIEAGTAELRRKRGPADAISVGTLGPGDFFGEIELATGGESVVDVVATSPMLLLRLSEDDYQSYLGRFTEVKFYVAQAAARRAAAVLHREAALAATGVVGPLR